MTNPHLHTEPLQIGAPLDACRAVVVAVHGRGQTPDYLLDNVVSRLGLTDVAWWLPSADDNSWYPLGFLAPLADNQPRLDHALAALSDVYRRLVANHIAPDRIVWLGFSQGACLVSEWVARNPARWGGLVAFTGGYIGPRGEVRHIGANLDGMPAYFAVGSHDEWVPVDRVHDTAALYVGAMAQVTLEVFPDRPHEIGDRELIAARRIIDDIGRGIAS